MSSTKKPEKCLKVFAMYGNIQSGNILIHKHFLVAAKDKEEAVGLVAGSSSVLIAPQNMHEIPNTVSNVEASCILWESSINEDMTAFRNCLAGLSS